MTDPLRLVDLGRKAWLVALGVVTALTPGAPALTGWGTNPVVASTFDDDYVMLRMGESVVVAQNSGIGTIDIHRLDDQGLHAGTFAWDPSSFELPGVSLDPDVPIVGCSLGKNRFALGYQVWGTTGPNLRVVFLRRAGATYLVKPGFPKVVGRGGWMRIVPNRVLVEVGGGSGGPTGLKARIDGVMLCWLHVQGSGPHSPVGVQQQGIRDDGTFVWGGASLSNGLYVDQTVHLDNLPDYAAHGVVSDGNGLAIVTYAEQSALSRFKSTKKDLDGSSIFSGMVAGQASFNIHGPPGAGVDRGLCLVVDDGSGGAYYAFSRDNGATTQLVVSRFEGNGTGYVASVPWTVSGVTPLVRPLALFPGPMGSFVLAYRDQILIAAIRYSSSAGTIEWAGFLSGATSDNTEEAVGVTIPGYVVVSWTYSDSLETGARFLSAANGSSLQQLRVDAAVPADLCTRPRIVRSRKDDVVIGWFESVGSIRAERLLGP